MDNVCPDILSFFFFQAEDGIRDGHVTGVQTCALPICSLRPVGRAPRARATAWDAWLPGSIRSTSSQAVARSEEHTSELQSRGHLVCRLLLEKKKKKGEGSMVAVSTRYRARRDVKS